MPPLPRLLMTRALLVVAVFAAAAIASGANDTTAALNKARDLQDHADSIGRELQAAEYRLRTAHNSLLSRAVSHRNALLRRIPSFWYTAVLGLPRYDGFLSLLPEDAGVFDKMHDADGDTYVHPDHRQHEHDEAGDAPWGADSETGYPAIADDHFILKNFLHEARCFVVKSSTDVSREHLDQMVHAPGLDGNDGTVESDTSKYYVPGDLDIGIATGSTHASQDAADESYRVVLTFKPNPYFADVRLYKQLPIAHAHMLYTSDLDVHESLGLGPRLGHGNTVSWSSRAVREGVLKEAKDKSPSFFAVFDDETYANANRGLKELLQLRAATFVSSMCMYLEHDPIPFYERRVVERESHVQRTRMILGGPRQDSADGAGVDADAVEPEDPHAGDASEVPPPAHESEFVDLAAAQQAEDVTEPVEEGHLDSQQHHAEDGDGTDGVEVFEEATTAEEGDPSVPIHSESPASDATASTEAPPPPYVAVPTPPPQPVTVTAGAALEETVANATPSDAETITLAPTVSNASPTAPPP